MDDADKEKPKLSIVEAWPEERNSTEANIVNSVPGQAVSSDNIDVMTGDVDVSVSADPVLARELVKILSEVEADERAGKKDPFKEALTPPTMPPSDTGAGADTPQEFASVKANSKDVLSTATEGQEVLPLALIEDQGERPKAPAQGEVGGCRQGRPGTAHHGLEVGEDTARRWMPVALRDDTPSRGNDGTSETTLAVEQRPSGPWTLREEPSQPLNVVAEEDGKDCKALVKVPAMPELLRDIWAARAAQTPCEVPRRDAPEWRHGELYFEETGKVCRYLVAPPGNLDPMDVAQALLDTGFGLPQPEMVFSVQSSPGNYWDVGDEIERLKGCGVIWPEDEEEAIDLYRRNMEALMLGVCTAANECGAWLLGSGRRTGGIATGALFEAGVRQFSRVHPERVGDLAFLGLRGPCGPDVFESAGVRLGSESCPWSTLINPLSGELIDLRKAAVPLWAEVTEQVRYPDIGELWTQKVAIHGKSPDETLGCMCLNPMLSHLLLCTDLVQSKVQDLLQHTLPAVHVVSSGQSRTCLEHAMERAMRGAQVLTVQNSGLWANVLSKAILERKGLYLPAAYVAVTSVDGSAEGMRPVFLPDQAEASRFLVFDLLTDNEERVVEKITNTLTTFAGEDTRELGFANSERQRLQYAWDLYLLYKLNAYKTLFWSRVAHYAFTAISLLTTTCAVLLTASSLPESGASALGEVSMVSYEQVRFSKTQSTVLALACSLLPLLSACLLSVNSRFAPRTKYASFTAAAAKVRSAIYKYRSRVGEYHPSAQNGVPLRSHAGDHIRRAPKGGLMSRLGKAGGKARAGVESRRAIWAAHSQPLALPATPGLREAGRALTATPASSHCMAARETAPAGWALIGGHMPPSRGSTASVSATASRTATASGLRHSAASKERTGRTRSSAERASPKPSERFAEVLAAINVELMAGVSRMGDMAEPTNKDWERLERSLGHRPAYTTSGCCCCQRRSRHIIVPDAANPTDMRNPMTDEVILDDAFSLITADDYINFRLKPLIAGLKVRAPLLSRTWAFTQMSTFVGTAVAGALGVLSMREFIPIVVAIVSAVDSVAQFEQLQVRMVATNSALAELQGMLLWWNALSLVERRKSYIKEHLINVTEDVASAEAAVFGCSTRTQVSPQTFADEDEDVAEIAKDKRG